MTILQDFSSINVNLLNNNGLVPVGREIRDKLIKLRGDNNIIGLYYVNYSATDEQPPHVHVGFRYTDWKKVESKVTSFFNKSNFQTKELIKDIDQCKPTDGSYYLLPKNVISDYIVCQSFDWLLKLENEIPPKERDAQRITDWFLRNKKQIFEKVVKSYEREFSEKEIFWILERFIHHLLNSGLYHLLEQWILIYLIGAGFFKKQ